MGSNFFWLTIAFATGAVQAHGGGLNSEGCHNDRKNGGYHCHRAATPSSPPVVAPAAPSAQPRRNAQRATTAPAGPTCYTGPKGGTYTITKSGKKNYSGC